jgi:hypothetical protein
MKTEMNSGHLGLIYYEKTDMLAKRGRDGTQEII